MSKSPKEYFIDNDYNCAESTLRVLNDRLGLEVDEESFKLVGGFGGGLCCGKTCGVLCGAVAALGKAAITERAHATADFKEICSGLVDGFEKEFGNTDCSELKGVYFNENTRCLKLVEGGAKFAEEYIKNLRSNRKEA